MPVLPWGLDTPFWDHTANHSGGTPRFHTMDGPEEAMDAVVYASVHPQKELAMGWKAKGAVLGAQLWPGLADHAAGDPADRSQVGTAPPSPRTVRCSRRRPPARGWKAAPKRMERDDAARGAR